MRCPTSRPAPRPAPLLLVALLLAACAGRGSTNRAADARAGTIAGVSAANPLAVDAGLAVLEAGGSAVDAAVAVQVMLGLVEPQSSGIGGGAFLMYFDARTGRVHAFDGRETAGSGAHPAVFLDAAGVPMPFDTAVTGGHAIGVPGVMPMLGMVHARFGALPWNALFGDAVAAAEQGFVVPRRLGRFANGRSAQMQQADTRALFAHPSGRMIQAGDTMRNPAYAATLRLLATQGPRALHTGPIADAIVARVAQAPRPGAITREDLANYTPVEREPLCAPYREYTLCVPPPPSSGVSMLQLLAVLDHTDIAARGPDDPVSWYLFAEGSRLMYADRDRYVADPGFVDVPVAGLLAPDYVRSRAALIGATAGPPPAAGQPAGSAAIRRGDDATVEAEGTSHFVIIDFQGNVVSMTTTVESVFGSGRVVGGFILNNEMTDFSFSPSDSNGPIANAVAAGKRPRSSMAPTIVLDRAGRVRGAFGSPGGSSILVYNAKTAIGALTWKLPIQAAINLPNVVSRGTRFTVESGRFPQRFTDLFAERGITLSPVEGEDSGLHGFLMSPTGRTEGGADGRRDGVWRVITRPAR